MSQVCAMRHCALEHAPVTSGSLALSRLSPSILPFWTHTPGTCWVRGPFTSPYAISSLFSHLVLVASGIGITPALGVLGHFQDSRLCIVVWMVRSEDMLEFFMPLLKRAALVIVYFTGKTKLPYKTIEILSKMAPLAIMQHRPNLETLLEEIVRCTDENVVRRDLRSPSRRRMSAAVTDRLEQALGSSSSRASPVSSGANAHSHEEWCALYCGGSVQIMHKLKEGALKLGIGWEAELFDW